MSESLTWVEVDLGAIAANVAALCLLAQPSKLMAVVKANAYGHGAVETAWAALEGGADWLGVYTVSEGRALREAGVDAPILVFGPFAGSEASLVREYQLRPTLSNIESAEALQKSAGADRLPYHIKVDTGLMRAGILPGETAEFVTRLSRFPSLQAEGIYTHFARSDEADLTHAREQLRRFLATVTALADKGVRFDIVHAANSAATLTLPESRLDMVRVGISVYGYDPRAVSHIAIPLTPALRLISTVTRVTHVPCGTGVGYGHDFRCDRDSVIALVPIGYGDGLPRNLGNGAGRVLVRSQTVPIVGRVSMDQITIDVTDVPEVSIGDSVALIGVQGNARQTADDVARQAHTISYEILSRIMPRVPRTYLSSR